VAMLLADRALAPRASLTGCRCSSYTRLARYMALRFPACGRTRQIRRGFRLLDGVARHARSWDGTANGTPLPRTSSDDHGPPCAPPLWSGRSSTLGGALRRSASRTDPCAPEVWNRMEVRHDAPDRCAVPRRARER
jgi:hypothetical protein